MPYDPLLWPHLCACDLLAIRGLLRQVCSLLSMLSSTAPWHPRWLVPCHTPPCPSNPMCLLPLN
jgi:hypothetical protein